MKDKVKTTAFANLVGALIFLAGSIWALIQTYGFQEVKNAYVQPATFPRIMVYGLLLFSVILVIQSVYKLMAMKKDDPMAERAGSINIIKDKGVQAALVVILLCAAFVALFNTLGYVLCGAIVSMVIMFLIGKRNWVQMILISVLVPLVMFALFYKVLTVNIPMGPLTFIRDLLDMI